MVPSGGDVRGLVMISTAVVEMVLATAGGLWVDHRFGTDPWGVLGGAAVGTVGAVAYLLTISRRSAGGGTPPPPAGSEP